MRVDISEEMKDYFSWKNLVIKDLSNNYLQFYEDNLLIEYILDETLNYPEGLAYIEKLFNNAYESYKRNSSRNSLNVLCNLLKYFSYVEELKLGDAGIRMFEKAITIKEFDIQKALIDLYDSNWRNPKGLELLESIRPFKEKYLEKLYQSVRERLDEKRLDKGNIL